MQLTPDECTAGYEVKQKSGRIQGQDAYQFFSGNNSDNLAVQGKKLPV